jgi:hypothetical protein
MPTDLAMHAGSFLVNVRVPEGRPLERAIFRAPGAPGPRLATRREAPALFARLDAVLAQRARPGRHRIVLADRPPDPDDPPAAA